MQNSKKCDGCPFCRREKEEAFSSGASLPYYSYFCTKLNSFVEYYVFSYEKVTAPKNCPELVEKTVDITKSWKNIEGMTKWEEITEGEIYHLPPLNNKPRMDVEITFKSNYSCTAKILSPTPKYQSRLVTWYARDWEYKFLKKHKLIKLQKVNS